MVIGGAVEMLSNLDVVIAGESAKLSLPEAKRGVAAAGGGLPRFVFLIGRQKGELKGGCGTLTSAAELLMTGRDIPSWEAEKLGLVNMVVPDDEVEARALQMAIETAANAPDSVQLCLFGESGVYGRNKRCCGQGWNWRSMVEARECGTKDPWREDDNGGRRGPEG